MLTKLVPTHSSLDALRQAGLDWRVQQTEVFNPDGGIVPGYKALYRSDSRHLLGMVGDGYQVIQNSDCFQWFDSVARRAGARYEFAGSIHQGQRIFLQARLGDGFEATRNDTVDPYLTLVTAHDGSSALRAFLTPIRLVCENRLNSALSNASMTISLRHTSNVELRLRDGFQAFATAQQTFGEFKTKAQYLANKVVDRRKVNRFLDGIIEDTGSARAKNQRLKLLSLFENGKGNTGRTAWHLYNSATEWVDHERTSDPEAALSSSLWGSGSDIKSKAFELAMAA